jgi:hypothetical protein
LKKLISFLLNKLNNVLNFKLLFINNISFNYFFTKNLNSNFKLNKKKHFTLFNNLLGYTYFNITDLLQFQKLYHISLHLSSAAR